MSVSSFSQRSLRCILCLGLWTVSAVAIGEPVQSQITRPIENQHRVPLRGNVRPRPAGAADLGIAPANQPTGRMTLLLRRPAVQEQALRSYIQQEYTRSSPNYHRWLTPEQLGAQFGPANADVQAVVTWLQSQGFTVNQVAPAKTSIAFSGTIGQVQSAFATSVHRFRIGGAIRVANVIDPQIPAALAPVVAGISPLNDFHPRTLHSPPFAATAAPSPTSENPRAMAVSPRAGAVQPELTFPGANGDFYGVTPGDFATIYDTPNKSLNSNYKGTLNLAGTGITIGIAGDSNADLTNVANYRSLFGLPAVTPTVIVDGNDPGQGKDTVEALLDLEVASAVAPAAHLNLYIAQNSSFQSGLYLAIQRALNDNVVNILNVSFGGCEANQGQAGNAGWNNLWQQAAAQGISVTVSAGDSGSAGCDNPNTSHAAQDGLQVNGIASTPYDIAVGGTDFNLTTANGSQYWSSANNPTTQASALSYIPEIPWNDSTTTLGAASGNAPAYNSAGQTLLWSGGGGVSGCLSATLNSTSGLISACSGAYPKPSWQTGFGVANTRQLPDVSLMAGDGFHNSAWVLCASNLGADTGVTDCVPSSGSYNFQLIGGTSAAAPAFAGVLALVLQNLQAAGVTAANSRLGQANTILYALSQQFPASFHDISTGNNAVYCATGSLNCAGNNFLGGYNAGTGYDEATGLGSVDVSQLVSNWSKVDLKSTSTTLTVNGSTAALAIQHGTPVTAAVTVNGLGGTPTGTVALEAGNAGTITLGSNGSAAVLTLAGGSASAGGLYLPGSGSTPYTLTANYSGDTSYEPSSSNGIQVTVTPQPSTLDLSILKFPVNASGAGQPVTGSVPYGTYISVAAHPVASSQSVAASQQATGTVNFVSTNPALNQSGIAIDSSGVAEVPGQPALAYVPGTYTVSASYSGDNSYAASSAAAQSFSVVKNSTTLTAAQGNTAGTAVVTVTPGSLGGFQASAGTSLPTGAITLLGSGGATVGTGTLAAAKDSNGNAIAQAIATLTGGATAVSYAGDANYTGSTAAVSLPGAGTGSFTVSASPATLLLAAGTSGTTSVSVIPAAGFTGTVTLSCAVTGSGTTLPTCVLAQGSVTVTGSAAMADTLTVTAPAESAAAHVPPVPLRRWAESGAAFAGLLLFGLSRRRRAWQWMFCLLLAVAVTGFAGCGGQSKGGTTPPKSAYTVTVTAQGGTMTETSAVAVTVE